MYVLTCVRVESFVIEVTLEAKTKMQYHNFIKRQAVVVVAVVHMMQCDHARWLSCL